MYLLHMKDFPFELCVVYKSPYLTAQGTSVRQDNSWASGISGQLLQKSLIHCPGFWIIGSQKVVHPKDYMMSAEILFGSGEKEQPRLGTPRVRSPPQSSLISFRHREWHHWASVGLDQGSLSAYAKINSAPSEWGPRLDDKLVNVLPR